MLLSMWLFVYWVADKVPEERKKLDDQGSEGKRANQKKTNGEKLGIPKTEKARGAEWEWGIRKGKLTR